MVLRQTQSWARQSPCSPGHLLLDQPSVSSLVKDTSVPQSVTARLLYGHIFPVVPVAFQCFRWDFKKSLVNFSPVIFHSFWIQLTASLVAQRQRIHLQCRRLAGDTGSIPGSERSPREGNSNSLKYSCLGNLMDREALWATVHGFAGSDTTDRSNSNNKTATHVSWFVSPLNGQGKGGGLVNSWLPDATFPALLHTDGCDFNAHLLYGPFAKSALYFGTRTSSETDSAECSRGLLRFALKTQPWKCLQNPVHEQLRVLWGTNPQNGLEANWKGKKSKVQES